MVWYTQVQNQIIQHALDNKPWNRENGNWEHITVVVWQISLCIQQYRPESDHVQSFTFWKASMKGMGREGNSANHCATRVKAYKWNGSQSTAWPVRTCDD